MSRGVLKEIKATDFCQKCHPEYWYKEVAKGQILYSDTYRYGINHLGEEGYPLSWWEFTPIELENGVVVTDYAQLLIDDAMGIAELIVLGGQVAGKVSGPALCHQHDDNLADNVEFSSDLIVLSSLTLTDGNGTVLRQVGP